MVYSEAFLAHGRSATDGTAATLSVNHFLVFSKRDLIVPLELGV
jgi:predicted glutamine amidotransferase